MTSRFLEPPSVGPAGPTGPPGPPGNPATLIDDVGLPSTTTTRSSFKISTDYEPLLTTASSISVNSVTANGLGSLGADITVTKPLQCGANSISCGAATCTSLNTSSGNVNAGTGMVYASGGVVTNAISSVLPTITLDRDISMAFNDVQMSGLTAATVTCDTLTSTSAGIAVSKGLALGVNGVSAATATINTLTSTNTSIAVTKAIALGSLNLTTTGTLNTGILSSAAASITVNKPLAMGTNSLTCGSITGGGALTGVTADAGITTSGTFAVARIPALPISQTTGLANAVNYIGQAATTTITAGVANQWITPLTFVKSVCTNVGMGIFMIAIHEAAGGNANRCWGAMYQFGYRRSDFSGDSSSPTLQAIGTPLVLTGPLPFVVGAITFEDDKVNSTPPYQVRLKLASITATSGATAFDVHVKIYGNLL
jgi:hypothetical protein